MAEDLLDAMAAIAGLVFGSGGIVFGIIGAVGARKAKQEARASNVIAAAANDLAAEANRLVQEANRVIGEQAARETERSDVAWEWRWDETTYSDHIVVQNIGKNLAKQVVVQFFFDIVTEATTPIDIDGRGEVRLEIPTLSDRRRSAASARLEGVAWVVAQRDPHLPMPTDETARVRLRVTWTTPHGSAVQFDTGWSDQSLLHNAH